MKKLTSTAVTALAAISLGIALASPALAACPVVHLPGAIGQAWKKTPGLGSPIVPETCTAGGSRCEQTYQRGAITWTPWTGAHVLRPSPILDHYQALGSTRGGMGAATTDVEGGLVDGGVWQGFEQGGIFTHPTAGTHAVRAGMWGAWTTLSREHGALGYPTSDEYVDGHGVVVQDFQGGETYWQDQTGGIPVTHTIGQAWKTLGGPGGFLGYPNATELVATAAGGGVWQRFTGGALWSSPATGTVPIRAGFWATYLTRDAERGPLGFPTTPEQGVTGGSTQTFQGGRLYWAAASDTITLLTPGPIQEKWDAAGGPDSTLGLPVGEKTPFQGGSYQRFEHAVITWAPHTGPKIIDPTTFDNWTHNPRAYGWPTTDTEPTARGSHTVFEQTETLTRDGRVFSTETTDPATVVIVCDSQCDGDSWGEQGARALGYTNIIERAYGGGGYAATAGFLGSSVTDALTSNRILLPEGTPGLVMLTLGGNDATQGKTDGEVLAGMRRTLDQVRAIYPGTRIVLNGVMSRTTSDHDQRRHVDALIGQEATRQGIPFVSVAGWGTTHNPAYQDGVHLTQAGHNTIVPHYTAALREALR